ncbi:malate synthase [Pontibacter sp. BAB1700]|nr:malate synthase [Pontibacter sp. BAB1700]
MAFEKVKADKDFEARNGFDGTWVAHPDLIPVAREAFDKVIGEKPHQKEVLREEVKVKADDLLNFRIEGSKITEAGLRLNINVGILYLGNWLCGTGAAAIHNLMEDAATAEISRAQVWQWLHHEAPIPPRRAHHRRACVATDQRRDRAHQRGSWLGHVQKLPL